MEIVCLKFYFICLERKDFFDCWKIICIEDLWINCLIWLKKCDLVWLRIVCDNILFVDEWKFEFDK